MEINYIILDNNSADELELLLDEKAVDGYKVVLMNTYFDPKRSMVYKALMINYGLNNQLEDLISQIIEKPDGLGVMLQLIETGMGDQFFTIFAT